MCMARQVKYHSPQQEHSFGCPYQLGHFPNADHGDDAMLMTLPVRSHCCFPCLAPVACSVFCAGVLEEQSS